MLVVMDLTAWGLVLDMGRLQEQEDLDHALRLEAIPILEILEILEDLQEATPHEAMDADHHHLDEGLPQVVGDRRRQAVVALLLDADRLRTTHMALAWAGHHPRDDADRTTLACHDKWAT